MFYNIKDIMTENTNITLDKDTIVILDYYDEPQLYTIKDTQNNTYLCLRTVDEEALTYTTIKINDFEINEDTVDYHLLRKIYLESEDKYMLTIVDDELILNKIDIIPEENLPL